MNFTFPRIQRLPPYMLAEVTRLKTEARQRGEDIIDFGMGNPDQATPDFIVHKMIEATEKAQNHRYSASKGIKKLRLAIANWYKRRYDVDLNPDTETVVTIGSKEGISHLALAVFGSGDNVLVPTPTYSIHTYAVIIANADVISVPLTGDKDFFESALEAYNRTWPRPKGLIINFPHNPTTACVEQGFFEKVVDFAKKNEVMIIHDIAYADIVFDGYKAPSFLATPGAKDVGVEIFTLSKSYNMPGWRVGFVCGNKEMVQALTHLKGYLDYGMFQPIQIASIIALNSDDSVVHEIAELYRGRRDALVDGLNRIGWEIEKPKATMFAWAKIPEKFQSLGSIEFSKLLLKEAKVAVSPGIGFGREGDGHVRFALVENEHRTRQAVRGIKGVIS
ncbi:MAG: aminotransferase class I/II-fold pyridoxal phosphate-dependent enzyme [Nitrospinae bacterium]|nr:aminotransferase class I/II-fold pyridoxal phosphate-dependent enzyme [Nitrospinota bacterium]